MNRHRQQDFLMTENWSEWTHTIEKKWNGMKEMRYKETAARKKIENILNRRKLQKSFCKCFDRFGRSLSLWISRCFIWLTWAAKKNTKKKEKKNQTIPDRKWLGLDQHLRIIVLDQCRFSETIAFISDCHPDGNHKQILAKFSSIDLVNLLVAMVPEATLSHFCFYRFCSLSYHKWYQK